MNNEQKTVKTIFLGKRVIKRKQVDSVFGEEEIVSVPPRLVEVTETKCREKILEIDEPIFFEVGEEIYLEELERYTTIEKRTHSTNGNIIYNVTYVISSEKITENSVLREFEQQKEKYLEFKKRMEENKRKRVEREQKFERKRLIDEERKRQLLLKKEKEEQLIREEKEKEEERLRKEFEKFMEKKKSIPKKGTLVFKFDTGSMPLSTARNWHRYLCKKLIDYDIVLIPHNFEVQFVKGTVSEGDIEFKNLENAIFK